jgi:hypothetical protein
MEALLSLRGSTDAGLRGFFETDRRGRSLQMVAVLKLRPLYIRKLRIGIQVVQHLEMDALKDGSDFGF